MKIKQFGFAALTALAALAAPPAMNADVLLTEDFSYPAGSYLYGQGDWLQVSTNANAPIQVGTPSLSYPGYADAAGGAVTLAGTNSADQKLFKMFADNDAPVKSGAVYYSALINMQSVNDDVYFLAFGGGAKTQIADQKSPSEYARIFACKGSTDGKFQLGMSKNAANPTVRSADLNFNETYLVVLKYEFVPGTTNDKVTFWVNPVAEADAAVGTTTANGDPSETYGLQAFELRQGGSGSKACPTVTVDAVRVATTWADLFGGNAGGGEDPEPPVTPSDATIALSQSELVFDPTIQGFPVSATVNVKTTGATAPVSIAGLTNFTAEPATLTADEANAGADVTFTFKATKGGNFTETATFSTTGAQDVTLTLKAQATAVTTIPMSTQIINLPADGEELYNYTGTATVTHIDAANRRVYAQDMTGALCVDYSFVDGELPVKVGDKFKNQLCAIVTELNVPYLLALNAPTVSGTGSKEPLTVAPTDFKTSLENYIHRLVTVENVDFSALPAGTLFTAKGVKGVAAGVEVTVLPFAGSDLIGKPVPASSPVTGISRSMSGITISPRSAADVVIAETPAPEEASLTLATEQVMAPASFASINQPTVFARVKATATALKAPVQVFLTGANAAMFSIDVEEIAAGSSETVVTITYLPTAIGKHTARLNFDSSDTSVATGVQFTAMAIDPENPPVVSADVAALTPFTAAVNGTQEQSVTVATANLPDYGAARVVNPSGAFRINSTTLLKSGNTTLKITFNPKAAGTFTDEIELAAPGGNTVKFTVTGTATGDAPVEDKQGDSFPLDPSNPLTYLNETFSGLTTNQPFAIAGWKNIAVEGTRAWWGYTDSADGNSMAKVTAYDSKATASSPATMLLATPALDYRNTASRFLTFRIKGKYLAEGMTDRLDVLYMDLAEGDLYAQALDGLNIPATADQNDTWQDYVVDLEGLDLADTFFIGFRFASTRGRENSATYFVDDVTWGRSDIAFIRPSQRAAQFTQNTTSATFSVTGINLTAPIALKMVGSHASSFTLSTTELPAEGGNFNVTFNSTDDGTHIAFVEMKSEGAPVSYIDITGKYDSTNGIEAVAGNAIAVEFALSGRTLTALSSQSVESVEVFAASGALVAASTGKTADLSTLAPGIYIARATTAAGTATSRIIVK